MSEVEFHPDFQSYLNAIRQEYGRWWEYYTVTDAQGWERRKAPESLGQREASPFDFGLMVQTAIKEDIRRTPNRDSSDNPDNLDNSEESQNKQEPKEKIERLPVLEGLRKYAFEKETRQLLLVGRPGSGKSTALARLLLEEAERFSAGTADTIPVLVELRYWRTSIDDLILQAFRRQGLELSASQLDRLLNEKRLLVLMDGMNELPTEEGRAQLVAFRRKYPRVPAIFTTRDLSLGGDAGIEKKLEMRPLTEPQMQAFVEAYLPERGEVMWQQLQGRLREFGETPLLLWMLCEVVKQSPNAELPTNLAGIFQEFTQTYEKRSFRKDEVEVLKGDVQPLTDKRLWYKALKHLAWVMMRGEKSFDLRVAIRRSEAERVLETLFEKEVSPPIARDCLEDLVKYHLLQIRTEDEIEFRHQLIQEYYAAEALRERLPELSDAELKREYLNYLKWTEPIALMLALVDDEALLVVQLALEVDWMLGARLAGEVKPEFQARTVGMLVELFNLKVPKRFKFIFLHFKYQVEVPQWLKIELWEKTRSDFAILSLLAALEDQNSHVRESAAEALGKLGSEATIPGLLAALKNQDWWVRESAAEALGKLGSEAAIPGLLAALEDKNSHVRRSAAEALGKLGSEAAIPGLLAALKTGDSDVRKSAAEALGKLGSEAAIPGLLAALKTGDSDVRKSAAQALGNFKNERAAHILPNLLTLIPTKSGEDAFRALTAIQANCKFYNYDIFRSPPIAKSEAKNSNHLLARIDKTTQQIDTRTQQMADQPTYQSKYQITGNPTIVEGNMDVQGDNVGTKNVYNNYAATNPQLESALQELKTTLAELGQQHPNVTTESEAIEVINGELTNPFPSPTSSTLARLHQQLLNPERHFQATKATLSEVVKHFLEESLWAKAFITYLETLSSDPGQGA